MPLSDEQDQLEHQLRVKQMETYAKPKVCADIRQMEANIEKMRKDMRNETSKIAVSVFAALVAAFAAGHFIK